MLEDEPERVELALRRCKKLTGTLVTLKRYLIYLYLLNVNPNCKHSADGAPFKNLFYRAFYIYVKPYIHFIYIFFSYFTNQGTYSYVDIFRVQYLKNKLKG